MKNTLTVMSLCLACVVMSAFSQQSSEVINVAHHGLNSNSSTICTTVLQQIIDKTSQSGGGVLTFPEGVYTTGSF